MGRKDVLLDHIISNNTLRSSTAENLPFFSRSTVKSEYNVAVWHALFLQSLKISTFILGEWMGYMQRVWSFYTPFLHSSHNIFDLTFLSKNFSFSFWYKEWGKIWWRWYEVDYGSIIVWLWLGFALLPLLLLLCHFSICHSALPSSLLTWFLSRKCSFYSTARVFSSSLLVIIIKVKV